MDKEMRFFLSMLLVCVFFFTGATIYSTGHQLSLETRQEHRALIQEKLSSFVAEGEILKRRLEREQCSNTPIGKATCNAVNIGFDEVKDWEDRLSLHLIKELGKERASYYTTMLMAGRNLMIPIAYTAPFKPENRGLLTWLLTDLRGLDRILIEIGNDQSIH